MVSSRVASCQGLDADSGDIENQIIASNPLTESLGNAKTTRNNNSSRFGKFIELGYSADGIIVSAGIRTYLLEGVRVVSHVEGERNFHIYYEIVAGSSLNYLERVGVTSITDFRLVNCSESSLASSKPEQTLIDRENFGLFQDALTTLDFSPSEQDTILDVVISVLHIGNLNFSESHVVGEEAAQFSTNCNQHVSQICSLLSISQECLLSAVGRRGLAVGKTMTLKQLSVKDASHARDTLARAIYSALFSWVLQKVNLALECTTSTPVLSSISVLDVFGFEFFARNSLEQLCINYTNEKLQVRYTATLHILCSLMCNCY